ncbi:MAG: nucleotidyl transferase AbiEii/AbiGii toxin family protein, partial [Gammaproteobacteria bacterium]|nr:nucleotidyl transferase AbiEii/AbiGii toxin family protein [Gammaproteobacteria bacterium]
LYAGKLVAALDRQHPRDLYDMGGLLANEGIDRRLRTAFVVYLISHGRPIAELLAPARRELAEEFARGLAGVVDMPVSVSDLERTREEMIAEAVGGMPEEHRRFLVSFETGTPDWSLLAVAGARRLPAVRWRMMNVARLDAACRAAHAALWSGRWRRRDDDLDRGRQEVGAVGARRLLGAFNTSKRWRRDEGAGTHGRRSSNGGTKTDGPGSLRSRDALYGPVLVGPVDARVALDTDDRR